MAAFGIHELRRQTEEEFPDASYGDAFGRTSDRVVGAVKGANLGERASKLRLPGRRGGEAGTPARGADRAGERARTRAFSASSASPPCARRASSPTRSSPPRSPACWAATLRA